MPMYMCRWPNGSFSLVAAKNKSDAEDQLGEVSDTDGAEIVRMPSCIVDFELINGPPPDGEGEVNFQELIRFNCFGERTLNFILKKGYPELNKALLADVEPGALEKLLANALEVERIRIERRHVEAETQIGREIQTRVGMAGPVMNRMVRKVARKHLKALGNLRQT